MKVKGSGIVFLDDKKKIDFIREKTKEITDETMIELIRNCKSKQLEIIEDEEESQEEEKEVKRRGRPKANV